MVERKMITSKDGRWLPKKLAPVRLCPLLTHSDLVDYRQNPPVLLPLIPLDKLHRMEFPNQFNARAVR
jgi:hypothetical protein